MTQHITIGTYLAGRSARRIITGALASLAAAVLCAGMDDPASAVDLASYTTPEQVGHGSGAFHVCGTPSGPGPYTYVIQADDPRIIDAPDDSWAFVLTDGTTKRATAHYGVATITTRVPLTGQVGDTVKVRRPATDDTADLRFIATRQPSCSSTTTPTPTDTETATWTATATASPSPTSSPSTTSSGSGTTSSTPSTTTAQHSTTTTTTTPTPTSSTPSRTAPAPSWSTSASLSSTRRSPTSTRTAPTRPQQPGETLADTGEDWQIYAVLAASSAITGGLLLVALVRSERDRGGRYRR